MGYNRKRETIRIHKQDIRKVRLPLPEKTEKVMTSPSERRKSSRSKKNKWQEETENE